MTTSLEHWLAHFEAGRADGSDIEWIREAAPDQLDQLVAALLHLPPPDDEARHRALDKLFVALALRTRDETVAGSGPITGQRVLLLGELYRHLGAGSPVRYRILQIFAISGGDEALAMLAELLVESPPSDGPQVAVVFSPLVQESRLGDMVKLFPRVLHGLGHLSSGAAILDMANYLTRKGAVTTHPAYDVRHQLSNLLGNLTHQLQRLEENPPDSNSSAQQLSQRVADGVSLAVSLCDALALIGDRSLTAKLHQAIDLRHRRIQTEAAYALAKMDEQVGVDTLIALAAEPVARLRVLAYADELGILDKVPPEYCTPVARAEAALVVWLAEPTQLGIPPTRCELVDHREMYWPGYTDAVDCFLFRYTYELAGGSYSNVGMSGPLVHSFAANLEHLAPDEIYAAYAGWQTEHEDIYDRDVEAFEDADRREVERLEDNLRDEGFAQIEPQKLGSFFGQKVLIAKARLDEQEGIVMADEETQRWFPHQTHRRPIGPTEAFCIYKGQKLLEAFN